MSDPRHPVDKSWVMKDPLIERPPLGVDLILILPGGVMGTGPWRQGCHAWHFKPSIPREVKDRMVAAAIGKTEATA